MTGGLLFVLGGEASKCQLGAEMVDRRRGASAITGLKWQKNAS